MSTTSIFFPPGAGGYDLVATTISGGQDSRASTYQVGCGASPSALTGRTCDLGSGQLITYSGNAMSYISSRASSTANVRCSFTTVIALNAIRTSAYCTSTAIVSGITTTGSAYLSTDLSRATIVQPSATGQAVTGGAATASTTAAAPASTTDGTTAAAAPATTTSKAGAAGPVVGDVAGTGSLLAVFALWMGFL